MNSRASEPHESALWGLGGSLSTELDRTDEALARFRGGSAREVTAVDGCDLLAPTGLDLIANGNL